MVRAAVVAAVIACAIPVRAHAEHAMCRTGAKYHGAPIDLDLKDADLHDVMRLLADVGNVNIVVSDTVQGKVTLRLKHVAWDLAACTIAAVHKLSITRQDNIVLVSKS